MAIKRITVTKDSVAEVLASIQALVEKEVLIGIPEKTTNRDDDEPINNATIGFLMERGMPEQNVPARPFLVPGVSEATDQCVPYMEKACKVALDGDAAKSEVLLHDAGIVASNSVKRKIGSNLPPPLAPSTVRGRKYARKTKSRRGNEEQYLEMVRKGADPGTAQSAAGIVALVNTGKLRNSITHVVRRAKS